MALVQRSATSMDNSGTNRKHGVPGALWEVLACHRWHATSMSGLRGIVETETIEVRPGYDSLCRTLCAISLFDFGRTAEDIESLGHWTEWCGSQQASDARLSGIPRKRVGVWLRVRDDYLDERLIDAGTLHGIWKRNLAKRIIPGVEAGHRGPIPLAQLDQVVAIPAARMNEFRVWHAAPCAAVADAVSLFVQNLPAEPLSHVETVGIRVHDRRGS